ncbi:MAG: hypothetical protein R3B09_07300 [Nannocystaceae bacterium]
MSLQALDLSTPWSLPRTPRRPASPRSAATARWWPPATTAARSGSGTPARAAARSRSPARSAGSRPSRSRPTPASSPPRPTTGPCGSGSWSRPSTLARARRGPSAGPLAPARREALVGTAAPYNPPLALDAHRGPVRHLEFNGDGRRLLSAGDDGDLRAWTLEPGAPTRHLAGDGGPIRAATWSADGRWIAAAAERGPARIWDVEPDRATTLARPGRSAAAIAFAGDDERLAVIDPVGAADRWRRVGDAWTFDAELPPPPPSAELAAELLALPEDARAQRLWSALGPVLPPDAAALPGSPPIAFLWIADDRATLRSAAGGRPRGLPGKNPPLAAALSRDAHHMVVVAADATVRAWGVAPRE